MLSIRNQTSIYICVLKIYLLKSPKSSKIAHKIVPCFIAAAIFSLIKSFPIERSREANIWLNRLKTNIT